MAGFTSENPAGINRNPHSGASRIETSIFWPRYLTEFAAFARDKATMRAVVVIFILALITVAGEIYSDAALTSEKASHTAAPDPATAAIVHGLKHG